MQDLLYGILAFVILFSGLFFGYRTWIRPYEGKIDFQAKGLLGLVILTLMGGLIGGFFWWADEVRSFAWDLPPLASRMLAAAAWSFALASFLALDRPTYKRIRLILLMLVTYLLPIFLAVLFFHMERFDFSVFITYGFFGTVLVMSIPALYYLFRQPTIIPDKPQDLAPSDSRTQLLLTGIAILTAIWGLALFITDTGFSDLIWVWPGDLLTSRLIAVMLFTITVGSLYSRRNADLSRLMLATISLYGLGAAIANFWNTFSGRPIKFSYLIVFGILFIVSTAQLSRLRPTD